MDGRALVSEPTAGEATPLRNRRARDIFHVALGIGAFVASCLAVHALMPEPEITGVSSKLRYYNAHKDEFDTVFIGTSRIYHQISPEIFDRTMAENGVPTRSFNLGVSGMHPPESFLLLERFLKLKPTKLKWVFIEFEEVQASWDPERRGTQRLFYWHNWRLTSMAVRKTIDPTGGDPWPKVLSRTWKARNIVALHLKLFLQNLANVGGVSDLNDVFSVARHPDAITYELGPKHDGYRAAGEPMPAGQVRDYTSSFAKAMEQNQPQVIDPYAEAEYRNTAQVLRGLGATPVFLVPPSFSQNPLRFRDNAPPPGAIIAFNDARAHPEFYDPAVRFDKGHLSRAGAEMFSRTFAMEFAQRVREQRIP
jgi:hypothetical protein